MESRHTNRRAERDHALDHFRMLAGNLARVDAAEALTDHNYRLIELLVGEGKPRIQFDHRLARTFGVRQDTGVERAMAEPAAKIRQRRERHVAGHKPRNQHDNLCVARTYARPRMRQCSEPVHTGFERYAQLAERVKH